MAEEYLIDTKKFYNALAGLHPIARSEYIMKCATDMMTHNIDEPWIREKPKPRKIKGRRVKKAFNEGYSDAFERFWKEYPKKVAKGIAFDIWLQFEIDEETLADLCIEAITWQKGKGGPLYERQYSPKPEDFLKGKRWEDENHEGIKPLTGETYFDMDGNERTR